ncbi:ABC transporter ATP-binding protein [Oricola sp.]|uniref:ABC transporter ATP-binding protein n=1 Tax=Oricola sp. TaxID=1979950 RepID=UPI0025D6A28E|nr:ABC transporter ATP-binding protein [Oricola sp.]MCI5075850.1 ABC transporter ATP-binding protein [Oricola sp.]
MAFAKPRDAAETAGAAMGETLIEARDVAKTFGDGRVIALQGANFEVKRGEFISLVGPSGCGKSTLLRIVAGLLARSSGELRVHGEEVTGPRTDVAMMFQKPTLLAWRTAVENVLLPSEIKGRVGQAERRKAIELLELAGLKDFAFSFPSQLSGGMQQRVALARLLQTGADVLLLDEPFGALDEFTRERLNVELARITREVGATTLFVTHNIGEAIFLADRVFVMTPRPGEIARIIDVGLERPRDPSIQVTPEFNALVAEVRSTLGGAE